MHSKNVFRMGVKKAQLQKSYNFFGGTELYCRICSSKHTTRLTENIFRLRNKHTTICDSNNLECESTFIQNVSIESASNTYSVAKKLKYNISDDTEKHTLYKKLAAWNCNGCLVTLLKDYVNNLNNLNDLNARNHQRKVSITLTQTKELTLI